ncbi:MAG: GTPase, partial [Alphaproteobacteria bacterium]
FVLADIPGLIEGAHEGAGIGDRFLGHVERTGVLLHLVDGAGETDVAEAYRISRGELAAYGHGLAEKPEILALNKVDALDEETTRERRAAHAEAAGRPEAEVDLLSCAAGRNVDAVKEALWRFVAAARQAEAVAAPDEVAAEGQGEWSPI